MTPANPKLKNRIGESLSGAHIIWEALVREGVEVCFGYPGGAIMPAYDAMIEYPIHHVLTRHEQGASHMADGYARATGRPGVAMVTSGPAATSTSPRTIARLRVMGLLLRPSPAQGGCRRGSRARPARTRRPGGRSVGRPTPGGAS